MNAHASTARAERIKPVHIGDHLREWRQRRHLSQLDLAGDAEISARHLSFVETRRAVTRDGAQAGRTPGGALARTQRVAGGGRLCARLSAALAGRSRAESGA